MPNETQTPAEIQAAAAQAAAALAAAQATGQKITLTQDEINHIKETTRQEERSKLQSRLEKAANLEEKVQLLEANKQQVTQERNTLQTNLETLTASIKSDTNTVDIPKLVQEVTVAARTKTEAEIKDRMIALEDRLKAIDTENGQLKLDNYRSGRLAQEKDAGNKFIAELVTGNSQDEIEASLLKAKETYVQYFGAGTTPPPATAPVKIGPSPVVEPAAQGHAQAAPAAPLPAGKEGLVSVMKGLVKGKSDKKQKAFMENREALLEAAEEEAAQANPLVQ